MTNQKNKIPVKKLRHKAGDVYTNPKDEMGLRTKGFDMLIKEHPFLKDYDVSLLSTDYYLIRKIVENHEDEFNNIVREIDTEKSGLIAEYRRFDYEGKDYCVYLRFFFEYAFTFAFIFVKSKKLEQFKKKYSSFDADFYGPGSYNLKRSDGSFFLSEFEVSEEKEPIFNKDIKSQIQRDIDFFFDNEQLFIDNKLTYKRGLLMFGPPGTGKSSLIKKIVKNNKNKYHCIVIDNVKEWDKSKGDFLRLATNDKKRIIIIEDIDGLDSYSRSEFLNFVDGVDNSKNMLLIATSNNVTKIDPALVNRPSRFDRVYYIGLPDKETRKKLLKLYLPDLDKSKLDDCVNATEKFSGAYFKELFLCSKLQPEKDILEIIESLNLQLKLYANNGADIKSDNYDDGEYFG